MSEVRKTVEGNIYFVTLTVVAWINIFVRRSYFDFLIENLIFCQKNKGLEIYCYCIMPNHIHLIAGAAKGKLSDLLRDFKTFTSKELTNMILHNSYESRRKWLINMFKYYGHLNPQNKYNQFWIHGNYPIELDNNKIIKQKMDYIHFNPVKAGFVARPEDYVYSSAHPESELKVLPLN